MGDFDYGVNPGGLDGSLGDSGGFGGFDLPSFGGVLDTIGKIGGVVGNVATSVAQFQNARQEQQFNQETTRLNQQLAVVKAQGAIDVAREQSQLQAAIERAKLAAANGLNGFYNTLGLPSQGQGGGSGLLMIAIAIGGLYFAWKAAK